MNAKMPKLLFIVLLALVASLLVAGYHQKRSVSFPSAKISHAFLSIDKLTVINAQGRSK
ncbi:hypothetical protein MH117_14920 [Paenibacillus sp. ACRRX]|uniref:hypothetical protein n=1 Tax=unclassified Paenibacillus TaxID=185978 RepID=UPI001EF576EB|nr:MULTISPECIES: hypothetical protein [unclassified Paenibacillus]MCG7408722.1 hypothetical protein [Paenibacillus sp. ACRRX]MDK8183489.1 hypothetical protein [Paenibacillus sp. UMB4589-SE434]